MKEREKIKVVFVCIENARRSQMAQGFAETIGQELVEAYSAGSQPAARIDPMIIGVMKEKGIDLSGRQPKSLNDLPPIEMDYLVTMGCEEACPAVIAKKVLGWQIPDPKGKSLDEIRTIRDLIETRVKALLTAGGRFG